MDDIWDVAVVGAGPAGTACALRMLQLRPQARVLLLDAADFPRDKACGDGIAPHAVDELAALGAGEAVAGYPTLDLLHLRSPGGVEVVAPPPRPNVVVPRTVFDARLVEAAVARGAQLLRHRVRSVRRRGDQVVLDDEIVARVVVGADGANSVVRRALGIARNPPEHTALAVRGYAPAPAGTPEQLIAMVADGWPAYAWSFPIGDGRANVGFGKLLPRIESRRALWGTLAAMLPDQPAHPASLRAHHLPLSTWRPRQPAGRVLLAGDAASLINPLTGEGIYYAVLSGRLAGEAALCDADAGATYAAALRRELGRHLWHTSLLARATQDPRIVDAGIALAKERPDVFAALAEIGLGRGTVPARLVPVVLRGLLPPRVRTRRRPWAAR